MQKFPLLFILTILLGTDLFAQVSIGHEVSFTDYNLSYKQWKSCYMIDQIDYTDQHVAIHFRYIGRHEKGRATFYGPQSKDGDRWYLVNQKDFREIYPLQGVSEVRKNGKLLKQEMKTYEVSRAIAFKKLGT